MNEEIIDSEEISIDNSDEEYIKSDKQMKLENISDLFCILAILFLLLMLYGFIAVKPLAFAIGFGMAMFSSIMSNIKYE